MVRVGVRLTMAELSELTGISMATLADFEKGKREPYERTLRDIKVVLKSKGVSSLELSEKGGGVRVYEK